MFRGNIFFQLFDLIKVLGLIIVILLLIAIILAICSTIYDGIVTSIYKRKVIKVIKKDISNINWDGKLEELEEDNEK